MRAMRGRHELMVVEDGNAGFEFFSALCEKAGIPCVSAQGKARVFDAVRAVDAERLVAIVCRMRQALGALPDAARVRGAEILRP